MYSFLDKKVLNIKMYFSNISGTIHIYFQGLSPMSYEIQSCLYSVDLIAPVTEAYSEPSQTSKTGFC